MLNWFLIPFVIFGIIYMNYRSFARFNAYFKNFLPEIIEYSDENHLLLVDYRIATEKDFEHSPFSTTNTNLFDFALPFSHYRHFTFITQDSKGNIGHNWLRRREPFFGKSKTEVTLGLNGLDAKKHKLYQEKSIIKVAGNCPACDSRLEKDDLFCPDCGLIFR